jgi:hypothetical protein
MEKVEVDHRRADATMLEIASKLTGNAALAAGDRATDDDQHAGRLRGLSIISLARS